MKRIVNGLVGLGVWLGASAPAGAQPHPGEPARKTEEVGSWLAACVRDARPGPPPCDIRHRTWLLPPSAGHVSAALEIGLRHGVAVPVVTLRGVSIPDATGTLLALATGVTVQFGADPPVRLPCGYAEDVLSCAPGRVDAPAASAQLRQATNAVIRLHVAPSTGLKLPFALPDQQRSLDLTRTADAIARLQPSGTTPDTRWDLQDLLDWLARQLGFAGGLEGLLRWLFDRAAALPKG